MRKAGAHIIVRQAHVMDGRRRLPRLGDFGLFDVGEGDQDLP